MTMLDVTLRIFRYKAGEAPHYDTFTVQVADTAHVIDAIDAVWAEHDRSLTFRRACHHSSCGSCALRIDGKEKLPCITRVINVWDGRHPIQLDPLRNFPIVSDLVVDVSGFFQRMSASGMTITRDAEPVLPLSVDKLTAFTQPVAVEVPDNLSRFNRFENCIECGICMSACPTMAAGDKF
jgi:succinate dehydrogenase / fumarate reductase iron-sulfur subunit